MYGFQTKKQSANLAKSARDREKQREREEGQDRNKSLLIYLILGLASIIALILSYVFKPHLRIVDGTIEAGNPLYDVGTNFMKDFGIAGLVAIFLAITFERLSSEEFRRLAVRERHLAKSDVFYYVYGYGIPESIRNEINTKILKSVFVRNHMDLRYTLRKIVEEDRDFMLVRLVVRYELQNLTSVRQPFTVVGGLEKPFRPSLSKYVKIERLKVEADGHPIVVMNEEELKAKKVIQSDDEIELGLQLEGVVRVEPEKSVVVTVVYQNVAHYEGGYDYFTLSQHTCRLSVSVAVPDKEVGVVLRDFGGQELPSEAAEHNPDEGTYHWLSPTPMLVNQGIYLAWNPRRLPETREASDAAQEAPADTAAPPPVQMTR